VAYCQIYLTEDQAAQAFFPGETFARKVIQLTPDEIRRIEEKSGERVRHPSIIVFVSPSRNVVFIDEVLGKHEFITYAVGVTAKKTVQGIEIMDYRESYGYDVRKPEWRKQFAGKDSSSPIRLNKDIVNISGATLSSSHVTAGVRRVLNTYEIIRDRI
jgi:Na+-translocating ferredoxin:NAD+ oxidoreductase RnfG subunit